MIKKITVIGLGSGTEQQLTLGIWRLLQQATVVYVRTEQHPVISWLRSQGIALQSFDPFYEMNDSFEAVYEAIVEHLLQKATEDGEIIYAVPGHPMVAERTTKLLLQHGSSRGIEIRVLGGESFLDEAFVRLGFDPIEGFLLLDSANLDAKILQPRVHTIIGQVYDTLTASDVKLSLMERYPDTYEVVVAHALGIEGEEYIRKIPLYELDHQDDYGNLSLVWVPRSDEESVLNRSFDRLHEIVATLRSPEGCPWDREQTHASLRKNMIEEMYEVLETIDDDDPDAMCEELGDLMLQIVLHSQIEEEIGTFSVYDVINGLNEKLIRRHPHVFGNRSAANSDEALANWQEMKQQEKQRKGIEANRQSVLAGVPRGLPSLLKAWKIQKKAATVGFDWERVEDVVAKVQEEVDELLVEIRRDNKELQREEFGDLLFATVNLSRFLQIDPEEALALANVKFTKRFTYIEQQLRLKGQSLKDTSLQEMEQLWQMSKNVF